MTSRSNNQRIYRAVQPSSTHRRRGSCEEARCPGYLNGFYLDIDEQSGFGQGQARHIRKVSPRPFREERQPTGLTRFIFSAGTRCFREHTVLADRPAFALVGGQEVKLLSPNNPAHIMQMRQESWYEDDWIDDNKEHLYKLARRRQNG